MKTVFHSLKNLLTPSHFWLRNTVIIVLLSVVSNHLFEPDNFPFNTNYKFPVIPILVSILTGLIIVFIARLNFNYYKDNYFSKTINTTLLLRFLFSTLGYITGLYIILYYSLNGLINGTDSYSAYHLLKGLSVSLLLCAVGIALLFSVDIYNLHKNDAINNVLNVKQGGKITLVNYLDMAFLFSENKIVYIVKTDGTTITTDFTLNEVEAKIGEHHFYRANRQTILHARSIEQVTSIENGKLSVRLKPSLTNQKTFQITISRYKKQAFMDWFKSKL